MTLKAKQNWHNFKCPSLSTWNAWICLLVSSIFLARNRSGETKAALNPTCLCPSAPGHRWICWRAGNIFGHDTETCGLFLLPDQDLTLLKSFRTVTWTKARKVQKNKLDSATLIVHVSIFRSQLVEVWRVVVEVRLAYFLNSKLCCLKFVEKRLNGIRVLGSH